MNNNMYLYFDSNGYLKEFITCPARAGSENVNSIYFYVEPALESDRNKVDGNGDAYYALPNNLHHGVLTFKLHDVLDGVTDENGVALNSLAFTSANFRIEDIQPFDRKRDLLFFKWFQKYQFVKVDLTADILLNAGNVECTIGCYNSSNTKVYNLDLFSFYVVDSAVQSANYVTTSQYHMLLALMQQALTNTTNTIAIVDRTISAEFDELEVGRVFYDTHDKLYYKKIAESPYYEEYDRGLLANGRTILRYEIGLATIGDLYNLLYVGYKAFIVYCQGVDYFVVMNTEEVDNIPGVRFVALSISEKCFYQYATSNMFEYANEIFDSSNKITYVQHRSQSGNNAYVSVGGTDTLMKITSNAEGGIMSRNSSGQTKVGDPTDDAHAANKGYVDNKVADLGNLFTYKGTASVAEINVLINIGNGWAYNLSDSGTLTLGNLSVETGDNVAFDGTIWTKLSSETVLGQYYTKQEGQDFETQIDNRVTNVENELSSVASGSPKGVYATLADLQSAYPTGTTGIYVVSADGHWYYWNGSAWTDGGVYLSTPDNETLLDYVEKTISTTIAENKIINIDGLEIDQNNFGLSGYIDISNAKSFKVTGYTLSAYTYYCIYDDNYIPINVNANKRTAMTNDVFVELNGKNYKYIRISSYIGNMNAGSIILKVNSIKKNVELLDRLNQLSKIEPLSLTQNYGIQSSTGLPIETSSFVCTDFIELPFEPNQPIKVIGTFSGICGCAIYDKNKELLLGIDGNNVSTYGGISGAFVQLIQIPYQNGMRYIRISGQKSIVGTDTKQLGVIGNTLSTTFEKLFNLEETTRANINLNINKSKVLVIGDSISTDYYGDYKKWVTDLIEEGFLPADTNNNSIHATGFVAKYGQTNNDFITRLKAVSNPSSYDLVIVFGGINDFIQDIPMGSETGTDYTISFKPAVNEFFNYLVNNFTQARLCVLLPLRTSVTIQNNVGNYQQDYSNYIKQVAKSYCLPILNLTEESGFCPFIQTFKDMWTLLPSGYQSHDGVHPTQEYEKKYLAPMIKHFLKGLM